MSTERGWWERTRADFLAHKFAYMTMLAGLLSVLVAAFTSLIPSTPQTFVQTFFVIGPITVSMAFVAYQVADAERTDDRVEEVLKRLNSGLERLESAITEHDDKLDAVSASVCAVLQEAGEFRSGRLSLRNRLRVVVSGRWPTHLSESRE